MEDAADRIELTTEAISGRLHKLNTIGKTQSRFRAQAKALTGELDAKLADVASAEVLCENIFTKVRV